MRHPSILAVLATLSVIFLAQAVDAQTQPEPTQPPNSTTTEPISNFGSDNPSLRRAMNLARQAAERANGGLEKYRAEANMYGLSAQAPVVDNGNGTWTFSFRGGTPGTPDLTIETVVIVAKDGYQVNLDYNGPIRSGSNFPAPVANNVNDDALALRRAMNWARQAAERTNGGLEQYRAEPAMYGSTERAPFTTNPDGTWTFRFRGGPPGAPEPTIESVVTVSRDSKVTINANNLIPASGNAPLPNGPAPDGAPEPRNNIPNDSAPNPVRPDSANPDRGNQNPVNPNPANQNPANQNPAPRDIPQ
jgi:hypothetical protein